MKIILTKITCRSSDTLEELRCCTTMDNENMSKLKNHTLLIYIMDISICEKLKDNSYEKAILEHRKQRDEAMDHLNKITKVTHKNSYFINMDLLKHFDKLFMLSSSDSKCLCDLSDNIKIKQKFAEGAVGIVYLITINNQEYIMKGVPKIDAEKPTFGTVNINDFDKVHVSKNSTINYNIKRLSDKSRVIFTIGCNSFINQTFIHMAINNIFKQRIDNYVHQFDAFYCKTPKSFTGFNIMNIANYGDLADYIRNPANMFGYDAFVDLFKQILFPLSILKCNKYGFVHADFKTNNIFVHKKKDSDKVIYKLADFDKSSIFWNGVRFYNNDPGKLGTPIVKLYKGVNVQKDNVGVVYYKFKYTVGYDIQYYVMNSPLPIFMSYDIYTLIISLFREPVIYKMAEKIWNDKSNSIYKLLNILFFEDDLIIFKNNMKKNYEQYKQHMMKIGNIPFDKYASIYKDRNKADGRDVETKKNINDYMRKLNGNNKGIGNINLEIKNYKLKVNIDALYRLFDVKKSVNDVNCELDEVHNNDKYVYQIGTDGNIFVSHSHVCTTDCKDNKCEIYTGKSYKC